MSVAIETKGLSRKYLSYQKPEGVWNSIKGFWDRKYTERIALQPTDISVEQGQIVGLVGANGAGKTTLLKCLSGLVAPSAGSAKVLGYDPSLRQNEYLRRISILLGQKNQLWWDISPADSYTLLAKIYELDEIKAKTRVQDLATMLDCRSVLHTQLRRLSLGERMKMEIIGSLLHEPDILFLDEPTIGLDIVAQTSIREFLAEYVKTKGPTVILTSHYMDDIAKLADRLLLISKGSIVYNGNVASFISRAGNKKSLYVRMENPNREDVSVSNNVILKKGESEHHIPFVDGELAQIMATLTKMGSIQEIKTEEVDFENVIHSFLEKESSVL